ncbi:MAG: DMT family transporter [Thermodesulfobacteriota bacterium]
MAGGPHSAFWLALAAAALFGASTPFVKLLAHRAEPLLLAGLLYGGAGLGALAWRLGSRVGGPKIPAEAPLSRADLPWLGGAVLAGGVAAPVLLLVGLRSISAAAASLLLSLEGVFTAALAWAVFGEHGDRRLAAGMAAIGAGALVLAWEPGAALPLSWGALAVAGACLAWAADNNLTRKVSGGDPFAVAAAKGLAGGGASLALGLAAGQELPGLGTAAAAAAVGLAGYGASLVLYVRALRYLGAARTAAYFSVAPFAGAGAALLFPGERLSGALILGGLLTALGVGLHLAERHLHGHRHAAPSHAHAHARDDHHRHLHPDGDDPEPHAHPHGHPPLLHRHPHTPDLHHRHGHR